MSITASKGRNTDFALAKALTDTRQSPDQMGTSVAMTAGSVTISNVTVLQQSNIMLTANTAGGTPGTLKCTTRTTGVGTGSFVIASSSGTDTSTVDWRLSHAWMHGSPMLITSGDSVAPTLAAPTFPANSSSLATSIALANFCKYVCLAHALDTCAHKVADTTNRATLFAISDAVDLASGILVGNGVKAFMNAHFTQAGVHVNNDSSNTVATANATDQTTLNTLLNVLKTNLGLHIAHAPGGECVLLV